ncbi:MAG TPA: N-6 DNA methylase, partial [Stellaceae bacterium]|nr:N-6 DNA methylase [Stellaceae bacterium]
MEQSRSERREPEIARQLVDRTTALELSAKLASKSRRGFAAGFAAAIASTYGHSIGVHGSVTAAPALDGVVLGIEARQLAARIAAGIDRSPPAEAAYIIGSIYTTLLPAQFRAQQGIFYTPPELADRLLRMAEEAGIDWRTARVLDPACGGGAFLIGVAVRMAHALEGAEPAIALQSIVARLGGFDFDPFGAWLAQAMLTIALEPLARAAGRPVPMIVETRDSLDLESNEVESWDLVLGNPPYGRVTLSPERRRRFARSVYGHANLYGVFTDAAIRWVKRGGVIGYVTPTSMLSGLYYKALRGLLAAEAPPLSVNIVSQRDGVFADVLQETMLATYRKGGVPVPANVGFIDVTPDRTIVSRKAGRFTLPAAPQSPWLLPRTAEQAGLTRRLRSMPHRLADYGYGVSTGPLVWNRHKDQFRREREVGVIPVV